MKEVVYSKARQNLKSVMDEVVDTKKPVRVTRRDHANPVIIIAEDQYKKLVDQKKTKGNKDA